MFIEQGGRGQEETPKVPEASNTTQPDQSTLEKRKRKTEAMKRWRKRHPDEARKASQTWCQKNRERLIKYAAENRRRKKEGQSQGGETVIFTQTDYWKSEPAQDAGTASGKIS
jgi:hypothetical protein